MLCSSPDCLFVHIPKTAGQSIEQVFLDLNGLSWEESQRAQLLLRPNREPNQGPPRLAHLTAQEYLQYGYVEPAAYKNKFKFSFVRNPWDRLVSEYLYGHLGVYDFRTFVLERFPQPESDDYQRGADVYRHVLPQANFLYDENDQCQVDFIGRFENLQADFNQVCSSLGLSSIELKKRNTFEQNYTGMAVQQGQVKPGQTIKIDKPHYSQFYDEGTIAAVTNYYARDIELFGYSFDDRRQQEVRQP